MKTFLAFTFALAALYFAYRYHTDEVGRATASARDAAIRSMATTPPPQSIAPLVHAVAISRQIEPLYLGVFASLDVANPVDLVPPLELTRERLLDHRVKVDPKMRGVYDTAIAAVLVLIDIGEERTKTLEAILRSENAGPSPLASKTMPAASAAFFAQSTLKRWDAEKPKRKANADQLFNRLRTAERDWNLGASPDAPVEGYDLPDLTPVLINIETRSVTSNALEQRPSGRGSNSSARQRYFQQNSTSRSGMPSR